MNGIRKAPSLVRILISFLAGTALVAIAVSSAVQQEFRMTQRGSTTLVTPDTHPAFFWVWLGFWFILGILAFRRGLAQLRVFNDSRSTDRQRGTDEGNRNA